MKKTIIIALLLCSSLIGFAQSVLPHQELSQLQRDSLLYGIEIRVGMIEETLSGTSSLSVGRYKIYKTENMHTSLKLDTATGMVKTVPLVLGEDTFRVGYIVCDRIEESDSLLCKVGRFELYPTANIYNFLLLDTLLGRTYQIQWSTDPEKCGVVGELF